LAGAVRRANHDQSKTTLASAAGDVIDSPFTSIFRATMLNAVALPLFILILGGSAALGMLIWQGIELVFIKR